MNSDMISRPVAQLELGFKSHVFDNKSFYIHIYFHNRLRKTQSMMMFPIKQARSIFIVPSALHNTEVVAEVIKSL